MELELDRRLRMARARLAGRGLPERVVLVEQPAQLESERREVREVRCERLGERRIAAANRLQHHDRPGSRHGDSRRSGPAPQHAPGAREPQRVERAPRERGHEGRRDAHVASRARCHATKSSSP
jgi:hypothetical protein